MKRKRILLWTSGIFLTLILGVVIWGWDAIKLLAMGKIDLSRTQKQEYVADRKKNLEAIYTALMLYHENEDRFPYANGWMDAIKPMLRPNDLKPGEELKKLKNPVIANASDSTFGYVFNDAASGMNKADLKDPKTPLVSESTKETGWNAHGKIEKPEGMYLDLTGNVENPK